MPGGGPRNQLLAALPALEWRRVKPHLRTVSLRARQLLHKAGEPTTGVYFPNGGVVSITAGLADGRMVEVATVGVDGMVGIEALFSSQAIAPGDAMVQVSDADADAEVLPIAQFRHAVAQQGLFGEVVGRYAQASMAQMIQSTACNALHSVHQRCARWLLTTHDRMLQRDFRLSHEFLAVMLGVQRPTVTVVAGALQDAGFIRYRHGRVSVLNRQALENASCECYAVIRARFEQVLG
jgi:CRP-like cAMP-binding protein